jgi:carbon-monoxide dehydrogenase iron sulfur subunit
MSGALTKDEETGATLHNKEKCVGCWMCVMVCPFGAIIRDAEEHIAVKCDLCPDRDDYACVIACPTGALFSGTKEEFWKKLNKKTKDRK